MRRLKVIDIDAPGCERPATRGECAPWTTDEIEDDYARSLRPHGCRPCPWVGCKHHLLIDVHHPGQIKKTRPFEEEDASAVAETLSAMPRTCSLDVADEGEHLLSEIAKFLNVTRQRVEAIEHVAQNRARAARDADNARAQWRQLLSRR